MSIATHILFLRAVEDAFLSRLVEPIYVKIGLLTKAELNPTRHQAQLG